MKLTNRVGGFNVASNCQDAGTDPAFSLEASGIAGRSKSNPHMAVALQEHPAQGVIAPLQQLLQLPGIEDKCELWRENYNDEHQRVGRYDARGQKDGSFIFSDIWDGDRWEAHQFCAARNGRAWGELSDLQKAVEQKVALLARPGALALALNIDWLQPSKNCAYSMGVVYLSVLNMPREDRYRMEVMLLHGVLPGPKQTSRPQLQSALKPLTEELELLLNGDSGRGVWMKTANHPQGVYVRATLLMDICDLPAARETCGFASYSAFQGCAYCSMSFPARVGGTGIDFSLSASGPRNGWILRTDEMHRSRAREWANIHSKSQRNAHFKKHGSRWCSLMDLENFDVVRGTPVDVMHNIYLGTCKRLMVMLTKGRGGRKPIINKQGLERMQAFMDNVSCPSDVGRIPIRVVQGFSKFKAAEWSNWMCSFAVPSLRCLLEEKEKHSCPRFTVLHLSLFITMQKIATRMREYTISDHGITELDEWLMALLQDVEVVFGRNAVTPNMHLHAHLADQLRAYGPPAGWWCNSYERFNGLLASMPVSRAYIPLCVFRRTVLGIGVAQYVRKHAHGAALAAAGGAIGCGPVHKDYAWIEKMMLGAMEEGVVTTLDADGELEAHVQHRRLITPAGRVHDITKWKGTGRSVQFMHWRNMSSKDVQALSRVLGSEPFPGGGLTRFGGPIKAELDMTLTRVEARATAGFDRFHAWHPTPNQLGGASSRVRDLRFKPDDLLNYLRVHYIEAYDHEITRQAGGPGSVERKECAEATEKHNGSCTTTKETKTRVLGKYFPMPTTVLLYDTLHMGGDVYGSMAGRNHLASFVKVRAVVHPEDAKKRSKAEARTYYAQVQYYFSHDLAPANLRDAAADRITHYFAKVIYYDFVKFEHAYHKKYPFMVDSFDEAKAVAAVGAADDGAAAAAGARDHGAAAEAAYEVVDSDDSVRNSDSEDDRNERDHEDEGGAPAPAGVKRPRGAAPAPASVAGRAAAPASAADRASAAANQALKLSRHAFSAARISFQEDGFPLLLMKPQAASVQDIIPIHRICGRFATSIHAHARNAPVYLVCPLASKNHA